VRIGFVCASDLRDPDGPCGCGRSFGGLNSHLATTTAMVHDLSGFSRADYVEAIRSSLEQQGWSWQTAAEEADMLLEAARFWPSGTVLERRLDDVRVRAPTPPEER
jgi:hypothetical protein